MADNKQRMPTRPVLPGRGGGPGARGLVEKPKDFKGTFKKLFKEMRKYYIKLIIIVIGSIGGSALAIAGPKVLSNITDSIYSSIISRTEIDFRFISEIILMLLVIYLISSFMSLVQGMLMAHVTVNLTTNLRKKIQSKLLKIPLSNIDKMSSGDILSRATNDISLMGQYLNQGVSQVITSITTLIGIVVMMITISIELTLITLITLPLSLVFVTLVLKVSQKYFRKQAITLGNLSGQVEETYSGQKLVTIFNQQRSELEKFKEKNKDLYSSSWKSQLLSGLMFPIINFIGNIGYVAVVIVGAFLSIQGVVTIGDIQAFIQYVRSFNQPLAQTANVSNVWQSLIASAERVFEILEIEDEIVVEGTRDIYQIKGDIEFRNVSFAYEENKPIIHNFSATIKNGQKVAIVGPTGAGKTTIVKLLMRFYEVNGGAIFIDGVDYKEYKRKELRAAFGMVLQDTWLFNGSICDNIYYSNEFASEQEYNDALSASNIDEFIKTLPNGSNFEINEEATNISQGQKQLLTISRAILANPRLLILDEATSSVDSRTEVLIQSAMERLMKNKTTFIIAHRLSTIKNADLILVMDKGDIIEQGKHEELLSKNGFYSKLYNSQFDDVEIDE